MVLMMNSFWLIFRHKAKNLELVPIFEKT